MRKENEYIHRTGIHAEWQDSESGAHMHETNIWKQVKALALRTKVYEVFVVRALKKHSSKAIYGLVIFLSIIGHVSFIELFNSPLRLEQLEMVQGTLGNIISSRRSYNKISVFDDNGIKSRLRVYMTKEESKKIKTVVGEKVTIYFRTDLHPFLYKYKIAQAINHNGIFIVEYDHYARSLMLHKADKTVALVCFIGVLGLVFCLYRMNRS